MKNLSIKTPAEIKVMTEGGKILREVLQILELEVLEGSTPQSIERLAWKLIEERGAKPSFAMVPGYSFATCINVNDAVVHGIPGKTPFENGDVVGIDVGVYYKGFHTDTASTVIVRSKDLRSKSKKDIDEKERFLEVGRMAVKKAVAKAKIGNRIYDLSMAMQETVEKAGYSVVRALTGHGVGHQLHEEPPIPCFVTGSPIHSPLIIEGMVLAIEIMYNFGESDVAYKNKDGWTIVTADGTISGLFEHTVAVTKTGPKVLT